jgi:hypothetical protein
MGVEKGIWRVFGVHFFCNFGCVLGQENEGRNGGVGGVWRRFRGLSFGSG